MNCGYLCACHLLPPSVPLDALPTKIRAIPKLVQTANCGASNWLLDFPMCLSISFICVVASRFFWFFTWAPYKCIVRGNKRINRVISTVSWITSTIGIKQHTKAHDKLARHLKKKIIPKHSTIGKERRNFVYIYIFLLMHTNSPNQLHFFFCRDACLSLCKRQRLPRFSHKS